MPPWNPADQVHCRLSHPRQAGCVTVPHDVHIENARLFPEEVIVKSSYLEPVFEQRRHHRIHFILEQNEVAHHDAGSSIALRHGEPAAKSERSWCPDAINGDLKIISRYVDG